MAWPHARTAPLLTFKPVQGVLAAIIMALLLSTTSALDTGALPFLGRTAYWLTEMLLGGAIIGAVLSGLRPIPPERLYLRTALTLILATPLITLMAWSTTEIVVGRAPHLSAMASYLPGVLTVTGFNAFMQLVWGRKQIDTAADQGGSANTEGTDRIYAIEAQKHYVIFHTGTGQRRELMRFRDAVAQTQVGVPGLIVHRSWWVARGAIRALHSKRALVELEGGMTVPVSRSRAKFLAANVQTLH